MADTLGIWLEATRFQLNKYGVYISDHEIISKVFGNWDEFKGRTGEEHKQKAVEELVELVNHKLHIVPLHNEVKETIKKLKNLGKTTAIVSSSTRSTILPAVKYHGLDSLIDTVICVDDVIKTKPDPESLNKALYNLKGVHTEALIVGDSEKDVLAGRNAKIATVLFYPEANQSFYTLKDLKKLKLTFLIKNFPDLLKII